MTGQIEALRLRLKKMPSLPVVEVGWPEDGPGGPGLAMIARILQLGTKDGRIPPRPVLASVATAHKDEIQRRVRTAIEAYARGDAHVGRKILEALAEWLGVQVRNALGVGVPPPNAASTIARKGQDFPLRNPDGADALYKHLVARARDPRPGET